MDNKSAAAYDPKQIDRALMPMYRQRRKKLTQPSDPFHERAASSGIRRFQLLGASVQFDSNSGRLLRLVDAAYAGLPRHRLSLPVPRLRVRLLAGSVALRGAHTPPPPLAMLSAPGLLGGATGASDMVVLAAGERSALVQVSPQMLRFPYHTRYELIEFAVYTLAARTQRLVPLHAACVGRRGRGILLLGPSGAGKSTITLQCLLHGLEFVSEDSVFVAPETLLATGVANFVHIRADAVRWIENRAAATRILSSPVIRRRSGVQKFEHDLRRTGYRLAPAPLTITAIVFLSPTPAAGGTLLRAVADSSVRARLSAGQGYAANQPEWPAFCNRVSAVRAFELRRGSHPRLAVDALKALLEPR